LKIERTVVGVYAANCYIVYSEDTNDGIVIDPGAEGDIIIDKIKKLGLNIKYIIITHGHGDHIGALSEVKQFTNAPVLIHELDKDMLKDGNKSLSNVINKKNVNLEADMLLKGGEEIKVGDLRFEIIHTPGHTPGGISVKCGNSLFTGDTLFYHSVGRTDFPGGSFEDIVNSVKEKLIIYPDETVVYPGHDRYSTIGEEKKYNPFIN
jgi:glyoxylase-like metal-dependent hydrolase (beta-lactamase superfamily II)